MAKKSTLQKIATYMGVGGTAKKVVKRDKKNTQAGKKGSPNTSNK